MLLLLYLVPFSILSFAIGDIDNGHVDTTGNAFCVAFFQNGLTNTTLRLHLLTDEIQPVQVNVSYYNIEPIISIDVYRNATTVVDIPLQLLITSSTLSKNAISIQTTNPNQFISVLCENSYRNSTDVFLALPVQEYKGVLRYEYAHFSSEPTENEFSTFILSNCKDDVIVPYLQSPTHLSGLIAVRDVYRLFADTREFIEDRPTPLRRIEKYESFHFEDDSLDLTGIKAWESKPFSFISSHVCTSDNCSQYSQQIPPSYTWGYTFITFPVVAAGISHYEIKVVAVYNTTLTYYCNNGTNGSTSLINADSYTLVFLSRDVCSISSSRPIGVIQILQGNGPMVWLPSTAQYINSVSFTVGLLMSESTGEFVWVTVPVEHFNASLIKLNGLVIHDNVQDWTAIMCSSNEICSYGISVQLAEGKHTIHHDDPQGSLSVIVFASSELTKSMYTYSTGFGMNPIGIPIVSFIQSLFTGSESIQPNVTLTRSGDIFVAIDVIIQIKNIDPLQFNGDFISFNETIHFDAGQLNAVMSLRVRDDLRVETSENFTLQLMEAEPMTNTIFQPLDEAILHIIDNDMLVVGFTDVSVNTSEEVEQFRVTLKSNIPLQGSGMNIRIITEDGTAKDTFDYVRLSDNYFLRPGESEWFITVTIKNDERLEEMEYFFVTFTVLDSAVNVTIATRRVQINIVDTDTITIHFMTSSLTVDEHGITQIIVMKDGTNDIPVRAIINTIDNTAIAGLDYERISNLTIEFGIEETEFSEFSEFSINVTILPDSRLEIEEIFIVRLSSEEGERVNFNFGNSLDVVITDDDSVDIGFSQEKYPTNEQNSVVIITVEIKQGFAERSFGFHVKTLEQQAKQGIDYEELDTDLQFPSFQSSFNFNVSIIDNMIAEAESEGFTVVLTNAQSDSLDVNIVEFGRTTVAITENDNVLIRMDIADEFIDGSEGGPDIRIRLIKTGDIVAIVPVTIALFVEEEGATQGVDFTIDDEIVFGPNDTVQYATIKLLPDIEREDVESFLVLLSPSSGPVTVDLNQILFVSIFDTDTTTVQFSSLMYTVNEGDSISLIVTVSGSLNNNISILVTLSPMTASEGDFRQLTSNRLIIPAGTTDYTITIQTVDDDIYENAENFSVSIEIGSDSNEAVTGSQSTTAVTITDNNVITVGLTQSMIEVDETVGTVAITVLRIGLSDVDISVMLTINEQSTQGLKDFVYNGSTVITIPAEETSVDISIRIMDDKIVEMKEESLLLTVTSVSPRVFVGDNNTTRIIIKDDDVLEVYLDQISFPVLENVKAVLLRIFSGSGTDIPLSVMVMSMNGTAIGGEDYVVLSAQSLIFNSSVLEHNLSVTIIEDRIFEGTQEFYINMETDSDLVSIPAEFRQATIEIADGPLSDVVASISTSGAIVYEDNPLVMFNVSVTGQRQTNVSIMFRTKSGSAIALSDYTPLVTTIVFGVDDIHTAINVQLINDNTSEVIENFYGVIYSNESAITFSRNESEVIIKDDEGAVLSLERSFYTVNEGETIGINVLRSVDITEDIDFIISTSNMDGDAEVGIDFTPIEDRITIQSGNTSSQPEFITPEADGVFENVNETFELSISLPDGERGAVISTDKATVFIIDQDVLEFTGVNVVTSEVNSTATVCYTSNIPSMIPIQVTLMYTPSLTNSAQANIDYNITQSIITIPTSPQQPPSFCVTITILIDNEQEQDEHLCLTAIANNTRISFKVNNSTVYCPLQAITVTIKDTSTTTVPVCFLDDAMVVTPFPKPSVISPSYNYHGSCEHVLIQQCSIKPQFTINIDHNPNDLAISRVALKLNSSLLVLKADDFTHTTENFTEVEIIENNGRLYNNEVSVTQQDFDNMPSIKIDILKLGITVELSNDLDNSTTTVIVNVTNYLIDVYGEICGLCGTVNGILLYSDQTNQLTSRNSEIIEDFARSWFVNPEDQITSDSSRNCGVLGNGSVVGDPLYSVPIYSSNISLQSVSLCFEIHGDVNKIFNLVSDRCVSVNALYASMINPNDGNIITSIGIKAVDNEGTCVNIVVSLSQQCIPVVNSISSMFYSQFGVSVRKRGDKVVVSVPNCENEQLVMWMFCRTIGMEKMLDFTIRRGLNLRSTSHGLMGQFWNIPVELFSYHTELPEEIKEDYDPDKLYLVTIKDPISLVQKKQFIGELSKRSWDKSLRSCLYVGSSQGGRLTDIPGPKDSVIEGTYSDYIVSDGLLGSFFKFSKFDTTICL